MEWPPRRVRYSAGLTKLRGRWETSGSSLTLLSRVDAFIKLVERWSCCKESESYVHPYNKGRSSAVDTNMNPVNKDSSILRQRFLSAGQWGSDVYLERLTRSKCKTKKRFPGEFTVKKTGTNNLELACWRLGRGLLFHICFWGQIKQNISNPGIPWTWFYAFVEYLCRFTVYIYIFFSMIEPNFQCYKFLNS